MDGGTFTISNGGVFGSMFGTPIINPPQSAILGMHGIFDRPVAINGKVSHEWHLSIDTLGKNKSIFYSVSKEITKQIYYYLLGQQVCVIIFTKLILDVRTKLLFKNGTEKYSYSAPSLKQKWRQRTVFQI